MQHKRMIRCRLWRFNDSPNKQAGDDWKWTKTTNRKIYASLSVCLCACVCWCVFVFVFVCVTFSRWQVFASVPPRKASTRDGARCRVTHGAEGQRDRGR
jgi:hypothetical protein